jgi:D-cysteine desulfhydrase
VQLARFPRRRYTSEPTPLQPLPRLSKYFGGPDIWIKRDDLTGLTGGGNKARKLEFLLPAALAAGCDTLITAGDVQSNHCRLTAAAAGRESLRCRLVVEQHALRAVAPQSGGNRFLSRLLGVESVTEVVAGTDLRSAMGQVAAELAGVGRKGYIIDRGGSSALGTLGYVACALELMGQALEAGLAWDHIVCASGSGGTQAGLLAGFQLYHADIGVTGISVRKPSREQEDLVRALAEDTLALLRLSEPPLGAVRVLDSWIGDGYAAATDEMVEAVGLLARLEGILLDPVYTGKAMAGLIGLIRGKELTGGQRVVFLHTGGVPALYAAHKMLSDWHPGSAAANGVERACS